MFASTGSPPYTCPSLPLKRTHRFHTLLVSISEWLGYTSWGRPTGYFDPVESFELDSGTLDPLEITILLNKSAGMSDEETQIRPDGSLSRNNNEPRHVHRASGNSSENANQNRKWGQDFPDAKLIKRGEGCASALGLSALSRAYDKHQKGIRGWEDRRCSDHRQGCWNLQCEA